MHFISIFIIHGRIIQQYKKGYKDYRFFGRLMVQGRFYKHDIRLKKTDMPVIKGITWDHPRGYQPLRAASIQWEKLTGNQVIWDVRSLKDFGDKPIEELIPSYDLIILDHPYVGEAASNQLLVPLDRHFSISFMKMQCEESTGPSFNSYKYDGHYWAFPIDAAAQVSAYRKDLISRFEWTIPDSLQQLPSAAKNLPAGFKIGIPLCPTDIWCSFLTLCAQYSDGHFFSSGAIEEECGVWALKQIISWKEFLFEKSFEMNPVQMLEYMSTEEHIIYVPFLFGYSNYSRKMPGRKLIHFTDVPRYGQSSITSLLGGTGIGISAMTKHRTECIRYIQFILSREIQSGLYYINEGQPAHLQAWTNKNNNKDSSDFFINTLNTLQGAYVRPRHKGFNKFQEKAADFIHSSVLTEQNPLSVIQELNILYQETLNEKI